MAPVAGQKIKNFLSSHTEMSSSRAPPPPPAYPSMPPSLNSGNHELQDYSVQGFRRRPNTVPSHTPYLGLRARLSQVWMNRLTILLGLIIVRLLLLTGSLNTVVGGAKEEALSGCTSVENVGSAMASMPHYLSEGVNALAADGITGAVNGLMKMLTMTVTGLEEIILFLINMYTSTYVCLITLVVSGSLQAAIELIEKVGAFMNSSISAITGDMSTVINNFEDGLNEFLGAITSLPLLGSETKPSIDLASFIDKLDDIKIDPTQMNADLEKLNASIPTFADVNNFTNNIIRIPFEKLKTEINGSMVAYRFNKSMFEVAPKQKLTFCSDNNTINDFFDSLFGLIMKMKTIFLAVLLMLAIAVTIPMAYREISRYRHQQQRATMLQKNSLDPMDVVYIASRPYSSSTGIKLAFALGGSHKRRILTRWFVAYATSPAAMFVLSLALAGLLSCACQYVILKIIQKELPGLAADVGKFAGDVVGALNNASTAWATSANNVINGTNDKINQDVFGWIDTSTTSINDTLNTFTAKMSEELTQLFGGTPLENPIKETVNCLIGLKIASFQKAITWVHDNAHIDFPTFRSDVFSLGAATSITNSTTDDDFLASPGGVTGDSVTTAVNKVEKTLTEGIIQETIIAASLLGIFLLNMLIGLLVMIFQMLKRNKTRAEGGPVGYSGDDAGDREPLTPQQSQFTGFTQPDSHPTDDRMYMRGAIQSDLSNKDDKTPQNPFDERFWMVWFGRPF
ncbi:putative plasma membrane fusion protein prm1 [Calycina marina]|uniref:Plasma membrane fusion protein PRM1 n=1 Tax=Calycina marina TaxID=1763456 RepID=A0A9P7ZBS2_9HELO|nr:putative plasma membrane fusion protein prm1 [Calycina marina]